jgi:hypothetical protein
VGPVDELAEVAVGVAEVQVVQVVIGVVRVAGGVHREQAADAAVFQQRDKRVEVIIVRCAVAVDVAVEDVAVRVGGLVLGGAAERQNEGVDIAEVRGAVAVHVGGDEVPGAPGPRRAGKRGGLTARRAGDMMSGRGCSADAFRRNAPG